MKSKTYTKERVRKLEDLPNVGKKVAEDLRLIGVNTPLDLQGKDAFALFEKLNKKTGIRHDPCELDVFISVVEYVAGAPATPWWFYTPERKRRTKE